MKIKIYSTNLALFLSIILFGIVFVTHATADTTRILVPNAELALGGPALISGHLTEQDIFEDDVIRINFSVPSFQANTQGQYSIRFDAGTLRSILIPCKTALSYYIEPNPTEFLLVLDEFLIEGDCEPIGRAEFFWELKVNGKSVSQREENNPLEDIEDRDLILIQAETKHKQGEFDFKFLSDNKLEIKAHFRNVRRNINFLQPFSFTLNKKSGGFEKDNLPLLLSDEDLGGDGILSPGETTSIVTFEIIHKNKPFKVFVDANALPQKFPTLGVTKFGLGTIISSPTGIDCGGDCEETFKSGTSVTLTATPAEDSIFDGWTGCDSLPNKDDCIVKLDSDRTATATFIGLQSLTVAKSGSGNGTVTSSPTGINCGGDCEKGFKKNTVVSLEAASDKRSFLAGWEGCPEVKDNNICKVQMNSDAAITAIFKSCELSATDSVKISKKTRQEDVDKIFGCKFLKQLTITGTDLFQAPIDFSPLKFLELIDGDLIIEKNDFRAYTGQVFNRDQFESLTDISGNFVIASNVNLGNFLSVFPKLRNVGKHDNAFRISDNDKKDKFGDEPVFPMREIDDFNDLFFVVKELRIERNQYLSQIGGFAKIAEGLSGIFDIIISNNPRFDCSKSSIEKDLIGTPLVKESKGNKVNCEAK